VTQKVLVSNLESLSEQAAMNKIKAPTIIIIGEVVSLQENLAWFGGMDKSEN
jgi:siroheme synthase